MNVRFQAKIMDTTEDFTTQPLALIKQDESPDWFHCQFCPLTFASHDEHKQHTFGHFNTKTCTECNVRLIEICDEWFESHTTANCQSNTHTHTFSANGSENYDGDRVVIKQEPPPEMDSEQLDDLLNVKADVELNDFGEIFAANLSTNFELNDNHFDATQRNANETGKIEGTNSQFNFRVVSVKMTDTRVTGPEKPSKGVACRFCDKVLESRFHLDSHIQTHHSANQTSCMHCNQECQSFESLDEHLKQCKWNPRKIIYKRGHPHRPAENFTCDICGSTVKKFRTILDHMNEVHSRKCSFKCRICERMYPNRYYLAKHLNRHKEAFEMEQSNRTMTVNDMDANLILRRKYFRIHPHRPPNNFICDLCGRVLNRFELMEEHMSVMHAARDSFRCRICGRVYPNRYYLRKHVHRHKIAAANGIDETVEDLDKGLMKRNKYNRLNPSEREAGLTCDVCGRVFKHNYLLMEHKSSRHAGESTFQCRKCDRFYPNRYYLTKHMKRHEEAEQQGIPIDQLAEDLDAGLMARNKYVRDDQKGDKSSYDCEVCGLTFKKFCLLTEHRRAKHSENAFRCRKCGRSYPSRYYLTKHMKRHEEADASGIIEVIDDSSDGEVNESEKSPYIPNQNSGTSQYPQPKADFSCESCGMIYKTFDLLKEHMATNHSSTTSCLCNLCGRVCPTRHSLQQHMKQHHMKRHRDKEKTNKHDKNGESSLDVNLIERERYMRVHPHRPASDLTCDLCQKVLKSYYSLKEHMILKHLCRTKGTHSCSQCKKIFVSKKRLEKHTKLKHSNGGGDVSKWKPGPKQMCSVCGRLFPDKSKMMAHEKTHFGVFTSCHICGKKLIHKTYLRKHIASVHSNVRPFKCDIDGCEWTFAYPQCLKRHQARKHGLITNRNACPICSKEFPESTYHLKRHLKAHANNTAKEYVPGQKPSLGENEH